MNDFVRPDWNPYFMMIALAVAQRANCLKGEHPVGAVIVKDNRIVSTGYNGTPSDLVDCRKGGCGVCSGRTAEKRDCVCVHAEQNAILAAARFGISIEGAELYCLVRPCFACSKEMIQVGIKKAYYVFEWNMSDRTEAEEAEYRKIQSGFAIGPIELPNFPLLHTYTSDRHHPGTEQVDTAA
jgi:dCMP deaminase